MRVAAMCMLGLVGCYHAAAPVPNGDTRTTWLARRVAEAPSARCPTREDDVVAEAVRRSSEAATGRAEGRALRVAADVPNARPLGLRLTNLQVDSGFGDRAEAALRFRPERPGTIDAQRDVIRRDADALEAMARDDERQVRAEVRTLLARARAESALAELAEHERDVASAELEAVKVASAAHAASDIEVANAELRVGEAEAELSQRASDRDAALAAALAHGGFDPACSLALATPPAPLPTDAPPELLVLDAEALAAHPLIDARWAAERKADAELYAARAEAWPWFDFLQLGLEHRAGDVDENHLVVGFEIALPIFAWGGAATDAGLARVEAERSATESTVQAVSDEVSAARAALVSALARRDRLRPPVEAERLASLRKAAASGYADARELARLERDVRRYERHRIDAAWAIEDARVRLDAALGR